jgi:hypothetical protein
LAKLSPPFSSISASQVCKALCGIAAGSSNGAIVEHWARQSNIADVLAKVGNPIRTDGRVRFLFVADLLNHSPSALLEPNEVHVCAHLFQRSYGPYRCLFFLVTPQGGAQHTAVSLAGLGFGMWFAKVANANPLRVWTAYIILTLVGSAHA